MGEWNGDEMGFPTPASSMSWRVAVITAIHSKMLSWLGRKFPNGFTWVLLLSCAGSQREESRPWQGHAEGSLTKRKDVMGFRGSPWNFLSIHPPRPESACFTVLCFPPTLLSLTGDCPPTTFFWKKLELLDNKSPGHNTSVSIQKPLWWLSSLPAGLVQLCMWLFEASWLQEAQEA